MTFGEFFKELRIKKGMTLRRFCQENDFDPGNISKIERNILPAPKTEKKLKSYAKALSIQNGDDEYLDFFDLAVASHKSLPIRNITNQDVLKKVPILFRTLDNKKLTEKKLDHIMEVIKDEMSG